MGLKWCCNKRPNGHLLRVAPKKSLPNGQRLGNCQALSQERAVQNCIQLHVDLTALHCAALSVAGLFRCLCGCAEVTARPGPLQAVYPEAPALRCVAGLSRTAFCHRQNDRMMMIASGMSAEAACADRKKWRGSTGSDPARKRVGSFSGLTSRARPCPCQALSAPCPSSPAPRPRRPA
jgi:hypothetical protein